MGMQMRKQCSEATSGMAEKSRLAPDCGEDYCGVHTPLLSSASSPDCRQCEKLEREIQSLKRCLEAVMESRRIGIDAWVDKCIKLERERDDLLKQVRTRDSAQ
jgi:hypothetical protein